MPKILLLTRYERLGASSRVRFLQFLPALRELGFSVDVEPLLDNAYVQSLYGGPRVGIAHYVGAYARALHLRTPPTPTAEQLRWRAHDWWDRPMAFTDIPPRPEHALETGSSR